MARPWLVTMADRAAAFSPLPRISAKADAARHRNHLKKDSNWTVTDFSKAIELAPGYADAYENRGKAWKDRGEEKRPEADFAKARELRAKEK